MTETLQRHLVTTLAFVVALVVAAQAIAQESVTSCNDKTKLCIGVRSDARPFSYKPVLPREKASDAARGPLRVAGYTGYMIQICDAALAEILLEGGRSGRLSFNEIGYYDIDRAREAEKDKKKADAAFADSEEKNDDKPVISELRFADLGNKFDIICDPATITNERRDEFAVSPPLFLTGISYITRRGSILPNNTCQNAKTPLVGMVGGTTASNEGIKALLDAHELPKYEDALLNALRVEPNSICDKDVVDRVKLYDTHSDAAKSFCNDEFNYYVGDLEIITENVKMIPGCAYDNGTRTYTNDRYAVFGKAISTSDGTDDTDRKLLVARFFEILSQKTVFNPSILDKAFSDTFQGVSPSRKLEIFYWSIRGERE